MPKRKRSSSFVDYCANGNPFFPKDRVPEPDLSIADDIIAFDEIIKNKDTYPAGPLRKILDYIQNDEQESTISITNLCFVLVPWGVKSILGSSEAHALSYEVLATSLQQIVGNGNNDRDVARLTTTVMTQSNLIKLVPMLAVVALESGHSDDTVKFAVKAFSYLVRDIFTPTLDVYVTKVLDPISQSISLCNSSDIAIELLTSTLEQGVRLLRSGKGNPKTTFQLFARKTSLLCMARIYRCMSENENAKLHELFHEMIDTSLFDSRNHMDGIRSLLGHFRIQYPTIGEQATSMESISVQMYQKELFVGLQDIFDKTKVDENDASNSIVLFPALFESFIRQFLIVMKYSMTKKSSKMEDLLRLSFSMFVTCFNLLYPHISNESMPQALSTTRKLLDTIETNDLYLPSHDKGDTQFDYLKKVVSDLVALHVLDSNERSVLDLLASLTSLMKLNHRLIDEDLSSFLKIFTTAYRLAPRFSKKSLITLIGIYQQLRSLNTLVSTVFAIGFEGNILSQSEKLDLSRAFSEDDIREALSLAGLESPFHEVEMTFKSVEHCIGQINCVGSATGGHDLIGIVVETLFQSFRIDQDNAEKVSTLCESLIAKASDILFRERASGRETKLGLWVCCSVLQLHTNCLFWSSSHVQPIRLPPRIEELLSESAKSEKFASELLVLAMYKLQQLHSQTLPIESVNHVSTEATALTRYSINLCQTHMNYKCWHSLASNLTFWVRYADERDIDFFLRSLFNAVCMTHQTSVDSNSCQDQEDLKCDALSLLLDENFYEYDQISSRIIPAALGAMKSSARRIEANKYLARCLESDKCVMISELSKQINYDNRSESISIFFESLRPLVLLSTWSDCAVQKHGTLSCFIAAWNLAGLCDLFLPRDYEVALKALEHLRRVSVRCLELLSNEDARSLFQTFDTSLAIRDLLFEGQLARQIGEKGRPSQALSVELALCLLEKSDRDEMMYQGILELYTRRKGNPFMLSRWISASARRYCDTERIRDVFVRIAREGIDNALAGEEGLDDVTGSTLRVLSSAGSSELLDETSTSAHLRNWLSKSPCPSTQLVLENSREVVSLAITCLSDDTITSPILAGIRRSINCLETEALSMHIERAISGEDFGRVDLHFLLLLSQYLVAEPLIEAFKESFSKTLFVTLSALPEDHGRLSLSEGTAVTCCEILESLLTRRDLHAFASSELASIHAKVGCVINSYKASGVAISVQLFSCFARLFLTMFQRYPKHLYTCAPLVVSTLSIFLELLVSVASETAKYQLFSRMCEVIAEHRDVFKKHVIHVVLIFIQALKNGLDIDRKNSLTPGCHFLLDTLGEHELKELNGMMDLQERTLFRSIFTGYKKLLYKGQ